MERPMRVLLVGFVIVIIVGAGYAGKHSMQADPTPAAEAPPTVEVTRGDVQTTVTAPGHLVGTHETTLVSGVGGKVMQVNVRPGQEVTAGEVLGQLDPGPLQDKVESAQSDLQVAQARLEQLLAGPSPTQLAAAQASLQSAQASLDRLLAGPPDSDLEAAKLNVEAAKNQLWSAQAQRDAVKGNPTSSQAQIDFAEAQVLSAQVALEQALLQQRKLTQPPSASELAMAESQVMQAQAQVEQLTAGPSAAEVRQAEAAVQAAERALKTAQAEQKAATLIAPFDGIVLEVTTAAGEMVAAGSPLIRLADSCALEVEVTVIEEDLPLVEVGQRVELYFDAQPDAQVQGRVARIVPERLPGDRPLYAVYIQVDDLPSGLVAGMTADASIVTEERQNVVRLPRALVRARTDGTATLQVWDGSQSQERSVRIGLRGDTYVEILEGLHEGERVVAK